MLLKFIEKKSIPKKYREDKIINFFILKKYKLLTLATIKEATLKNVEELLLALKRILRGTNFMIVKNINTLSQDILFLRPKNQE